MSDFLKCAGDFLRWYVFKLIKDLCIKDIRA
jgi:hypothetical protein